MFDCGCRKYTTNNRPCVRICVMCEECGADFKPGWTYVDFKNVGFSEWVIGYSNSFWKRVFMESQKIRKPLQNILSFRKQNAIKTSALIYLIQTINWLHYVCSNYSFNVLFIPYFRLLVFGSLVTLVAWFSLRFFPLSCPSCLAKSKQRLQNIFVTS